MSTLNLTKYISEAASAIVEAKLKMTDVTAAVELCNSLHHMYAEFSSHLLENWHKFLSVKKDDRVSVLVIFVILCFCCALSENF
jgi:regulator of nonsense transcripts 2